MTMAFDYEADIAGALGRFFETGMVYKGLKPVHWCTYDQTALAEAEVEYADHTSPSVYVRFRLTDESVQALDLPIEKPLYAVIWTTTPWTLPANLAIAVQARLRLRRRRARRRELHPRRPSWSKTVDAEVRLDATTSVGEDLQGLGVRAPAATATPSSRAKGSSSSATTSRSTPARASSTPRPATAPTTSTPAAATASTIYTPVNHRGEFTDDVAAAGPACTSSRRTR